MKSLGQFVGFVALFALSPISWSQEISCDQIRFEITAQSEVLAIANTALLRKISGRTDCLFTAQEVYRAAYGSKPLPNDEPHKERHHDNEDD
jgi:hypothetical protein